MDWDQVQSRWLEIKGAARARWGRLTDDDLEFMRGERDRIVGRLQQRYDYAREDAEREVESWRDGLKAMHDHSRLLDEIERLKAEVASFAKVARDGLSSGADQASVKADQIAKELETAIERNPMQAVLIAAGVGLIIGLLSKSNR